MRCEKVLAYLSLFVDSMLDERLAGDVSAHLEICVHCREEFSRFKNLRAELRGLDRVEAPDYLSDLVAHQIHSSKENSWWLDIRSDLEYWWSRIRTTEGQWYLTRLTGAMATLILFIAISAAVNPIYLALDTSHYARGEGEAPQILTANMQRVFGSPLQAQKRPIPSSDPRINDEYLANFAQKVANTANDDTVSVVTMVDSKGAAKVQNVLEYPEDNSLLNDFTEMLSSAGWRPASQNGRAVNSPLVVTFTKIYVYD
jgi:hypothetical protein